MLEGSNHKKKRGFSPFPPLCGELCNIAILLLKQKISELEEELNRYKNRNSRNSSTPPSQDFKRNIQNHTHLGGHDGGGFDRQIASDQKDRECVSDRERVR